MTQVGIIFIFVRIWMIFAFHIVETMVHCINMIFEVAWILKLLITFITKMGFFFCNAWKQIVKVYNDELSMKKGESIFDIPFVIQSNTEIMKKILGAL